MTGGKTENCKKLIFEMYAKKKNGGKKNFPNKNSCRTKLAGENNHNLAILS